jgi:hypothetical protein
MGDAHRLRMSATRTAFILIAIAFASLAPSVAGGKGPWRKVTEDREWTRGRASAYCELYDPKTLISFEGTIVDVGHFSPGAAASRGIVLTVALADGERLEVHVGPAWFASAHGVTFTNGDSVSVVGSRVTHRKQRIVVAAEVTKGMTTLRLRDLSGVPLWRAVPPSS